MTVLAIGFASRAETLLGTHDARTIVIDEVAGMLVTAIGVPFRWPEIVAAFVVFRVLDIIKPWPIRWVDARMGGGLGVVLDDVLAGALGCVLLHGAARLAGGWW